MTYPKGFLTVDVKGQLDLQHVVSVGQDKAAYFLPSYLLLS
jgi:hypothetical protein